MAQKLQRIPKSRIAYLNFCDTKAVRPLSQIVQGLPVFATKGVACRSQRFGGSWMYHR